MRRSLFILLGAALGLGLVFFATQRLASRLCCEQMARAAGDELDWLRREFNLDAETLAAVRKLHEGYRPQCQAYCDRIAAATTELKSLLAQGDPGRPEIGQKLGEIGALRAQCQAGMLRHFGEISRAMPPEQGRRYWEEMRQLTLGFHEQIEQSMSPAVKSKHGH